MNRLVAACVFGAFALVAASNVACSPIAVGDPCTPEQEFSVTSGAANPDDLTIDVNSVQCETRVCLSHYFKGRVTCPYGNANTQKQTGDCLQLGDHRNVYRIGGTADGAKCCPVPGTTTPIQFAVPPQCSGRPVTDSVYCSCRCDIPDPGTIAGITPAEANELDKSKVQLCECPSGYKCKPLCDQTHGNCSIVPKGKWGSYCVRDNPNGVGVADSTDPASVAASKCGSDVQEPPL